MKNFYYSGAVIILCFGLHFLCLPFSIGQDAPVTPATENVSAPELVEPLQIKLSVNEVRIDVVVLDKKTGNPITDLTAADFEVLQDDRRQEVKSSVYIDSQPDETAQSAAVRKTDTNFPSSTTSLKQEDVRRTILFVLDDYAMSFENGYYAKTALRNFVEKQMQPGDLVSILRTGYGNSALNMFQSDKREVLARINSLPSTMAPRGSGLGGIGPGAWQNFMITSHENQKATISHGIRALNNMPGRKILILVTPLSTHADPNALVAESIHDMPVIQPGMPTTKIQSASIANANRLRRYEELYRGLADEALRAGVVVNLLDVDGLYTMASNYADAAVWLGGKVSGGGGIPAPGSAPIPDGPMQQILAILQAPRSDPIRPANPLPALTGGITIQDKNFFLDGISREVESLMRGYYLISYEPPSNTFETRGRNDVYRSLKVRVNRKDVVVHTRSGFFSRLESELDADTPKQHPLVEAIYSPFQSTDLNVDIVAGYVNDAKSGYLVRSWIHFDPKDVKIIETEGGGGRINLETLCVTSDINGNIQDTKHAEFSLSNINSPEDIAWIQKHGIRFSLLLPVKKPGPYYVQVSVQDKETGKVGSAYQFLEIPEIKKNALALSNIFMITSVDDLVWMSSDVTKDIAGGVFFPMYQGEARSPALRTYMSGDNLHTLVMLYNADEKAIARSEIEIQTILYKDGKEWLRNEPIPIAVAGEKNPDGIPIVQKLTIRPDMPPGDYMLQLAVTDKKNSKRQEGNAIQFLSFTVVDNPNGQ